MINTVSEKIIESVRDECKEAHSSITRYTASVTIPGQMWANKDKQPFWGRDLVQDRGKEQCQNLIHDLIVNKKTSFTHAEWTAHGSPPWDAYVTADRFWYQPTAAANLSDAAERVFMALTGSGGKLEECLADALRTSGTAG